MNQKHFTDEFADAITNDATLTETAKRQVLLNLARLKETKVNILITGATGCGKSSTINALFNSEKAKVGQGVSPETMDITKYEFDNIVLFDSPGLGDGKEADLKHSKNIIDKLYEKDRNGDMLIDLVLVILDGGSRDLGTSFDLINKVIIPDLGADKKRLLVAINQADMAMKGRSWNLTKNSPEPELVKFLDEKVLSTRLRIKEATGVDIEPIYYSAGYKEGDQAQTPYNLSKLLLFILQHTKEEKRAAIAQDINRDPDNFKRDDGLDDYRGKIRATLWESVKTSASKGSDIGGEIGSIFGSTGRAIGGAIGGFIGAVGGLFSSFWD
ncbi:MAG: 50S ribosome-binding GTPase [Gallionella sp.]|nr:50S ribosome-binding GTPase [Gallionella sp.]MDD4958652.1 50S ribosome-binding GTPase [Gallionella sp.]